MNGSRRTAVAWVRVLVSAVMPMASMNAWTAQDTWRLQDPLGAMPLESTAYADLHDEGGVGVSCRSGLEVSVLLSLDQAVGFALCHNPQLSSAWAAVGVQAGALGEARAAFLPTFRASFGEVRNRTVYPDGGGVDRSERGRTAQLSLGFRLFDFGARTANRDTADARLSAARAQQNAVLQTVLASVVGSYFDAVTSQALLRARLDAADLAQRTMDVVSRRESLGAAASSDRLQAAVSVAKAVLAKNRAQGEARKALAGLAYALGADAGQNFGVPDVLERPAVKGIGELADWLAGLQSQHPAIVAARAHHVAAQSKVLAVIAEGRPTIDFSANHYRNGYPNQNLPSTRTDTTSLGVTLTVPLFDGFGRHYQVLGAQARSEQDLAAWQDIEQKVAMQVAQAHGEALAAWESLAASQTLLSVATQANESAERRYAKGAADILELLTSQAARSDAALESIRGLSQWHAAHLQLWASVGRIGTFQ